MDQLKGLYKTSDQVLREYFREELYFNLINLIRTFAFKSVWDDF